MKKLKMGPWHPADIQPVHPGVYEVDEADADGRAFSLWNGNHWGLTRWECFGEGTVEDAVQRAESGGADYFGETQKGWRGLAKRPSP